MADYNAQDLYALAQQAGVGGFSQQLHDQTRAMYDAAQSPDTHDLPNMAPQEPSGDAKDPWANPDLGTVDPQAAANLGHVTGFGESTGFKSGGGWGTGAEVSGHAYNANTNKLLDQRDKPLASKMDQAAAQTQSDFAPVVSATTLARNEGVEAAKSHMDALEMKAQEERDAAHYMEGLHNDFNKKEQDIMVTEAARKNQLMAQYTASLADFAAQKVDPTQLWSGMSGGMRFGTMVTAFVHDFLGAKGIKTSAMDTLNQALDRNIQAQVHNIAHKGEVAKGFKSLYEMEAERAHSEEETRARLKGYMLEAAKQHVIANMSQYQSLLATAQGKEAIAQIDEAYAKNLGTVQEHIATVTDARQKNALSWEEAKMHNAMEGYKASISARANKLEEDKFKDMIKQRDAAEKQARKDANVAEGGKILDPESGKFIFQMRKDAKGEYDKAAMAKVNQKFEDAASVNETIKDIQKLTRAAGKGGIVDDVAGITRFDDETRRQIEPLRRELAVRMAKQASGGRPNKEEIDSYLVGLPIDTFLTRGGVDKILAHTRLQSLQDANRSARQVAVDIPEGEQTQGPTNTAFKVSTVEAKNEVRGAQETGTDVALKAISKPAAHKPADAETLKAVGIDQTDANLAWGAAANSDRLIGAQPLHTTAQETDNKFYKDKEGKATTLDKADMGDAPGWAVGMMGLAKEAKSDPNSQEAKRAEKKLIEIAFGPPAPAENDPVFGNFTSDEYGRVKHYATYLVHSLNTPGAKQAEDSNKARPQIDYGDQNVK